MGDASYIPAARLASLVEAAVNGVVPRVSEAETRALILMLADEGVRRIAAERARHSTVEGWTDEHDDFHCHGEMALAASCYASKTAQPYNDLRFGPGHPPPRWPWEASWWKPRDDVRDLERAGALIAAEIGRRIRASAAVVR